MVRVGSPTIIYETRFDPHMNDIKKAIKTTLIFLLAAALISEAILQCFFQSENRLYQDARERDALAGTIDFVTIGSSIGEYGFVPAILDEELGTNSYNLAYSWMTMQGRYELLDIELARNPVKTAIIEISADTLTKTPTSDIPEGDLYMLGRVHSAARRIPFFLKNISPKYYGWTYYQMLKRGIGCIGMMIDGSYTTQNEVQQKGYTPYDEDRKLLGRTRDEKLQALFGSEPQEEKIWEGNLTSLEKIIDLCKANGTEPVIVMLPASRRKLAKVNNLQYFSDALAEICSENGAAFYDFNLLKKKNKLLPDKTAYVDETHLSNQGAAAFSKHFARLLKKSQEGTDISVYFYRNYDEMYQNESYLN